MDIYSLITEIAKWVGWPIVAVVSLLTGGYAFWVLNQRIEGLKEKNSWLESKLKDAEAYSPSVLVERLATRYKILTEELEKLQAEYVSEQQKNDYLEAERKQRINELETQRFKIDQELDRVDIQLHTPRHIATYFDSWYSQNGTLSIFCSDIEWLTNKPFSRVIKVLQEKGTHLNLYLRDTNHDIVKKLAASGARVYHIRPEVKSFYRFSILDSNGSRSILIRSKLTEEGEIEFVEYKDQSPLIDLALDMLEICYDARL